MVNDSHVFCVLQQPALVHLSVCLGMVDHIGCQQHSGPSVSREAAETRYSSSNEVILFRLSEGQFTRTFPSIFRIYLMCKEIVEDDS